MHPPANSSHKGLLVRYVAPTRADAQVREVRECARIGFAFFKPIIYQSRPPPRFHPESHSPAGSSQPTAEQLRQRGKADRGADWHFSAVSGRKIMSLFKERKFSFAATENRSSILPNALFALSLPRLPPRRMSTHCCRNSVQRGERAVARSRVLRNLTTAACRIPRLRHRTYLSFVSSICDVRIRFKGQFDDWIE